MPTVSKIKYEKGDSLVSMEANYYKTGISSQPIPDLTLAFAMPTAHWTEEEADAALYQIKAFEERLKPVKQRLELVITNKILNQLI